MRAYRFIDPTNLAFRLRVMRRGRGERRTVYFVAHNRNHVRLMADAAGAVAATRLKVVFAHLDGFKRGGVAIPELDALGLASIGYEDLKAAVRPGDVLVTGNDFGPAHFRHFIDSVNAGLLTVIGLVEGARAVRKHRYQRVDILLAMGPASRAYFPREMYIVGSPVIERSITGMKTRREGRFVLINLKPKDEDREALAAAEATANACAAIGVPSVISIHPNMAARVRLPGASTADFAELLPEALALVSRPSTTIYEAIAARIPVVLYPPIDPLVEFAEPRGAFRLTRSEADLGADLAAAIASRPYYAEQGKAFLEANLSIDPDKPSSRRIADTLIKIEAATQR